MKEILIFNLTVILMIGSISMALPSVHAAEVPGWIKNNAGLYIQIQRASSQHF